jgi:hypothetical protein
MGFNDAHEFRIAAIANVICKCLRNPAGAFECERRAHGRLASGVSAEFPQPPAKGIEKQSVVAPFVAADFEDLWGFARDRREQRSRVGSIGGAEQSFVYFGEGRGLDEQAALIGREPLEDFVRESAERISAGAEQTIDNCGLLIDRVEREGQGRRRAVRHVA